MATIFCLISGMTTKLQRSINPLTIAPHNNPLCTISHQCCLELGSGLQKRVSLSLMDRMQEFQNIESVRKMILMQEEVFKQQVQELHRIYNLQKKLMQELKTGLKIAAQTDKTDSGIAAWNKTERETGRCFQAFAARDDLKELSGSCSEETPRMPIKFDLEIPAETIAPSNVQTFEERKELKMIDEESDVEVELTLSIGHGTRKQRSKKRHQLHDSDDQLNNQVGEVGLSSTGTNKGDEYREPGSITSSSPVYQENTRPHWLLQDLSLNRT